MKYTFLLIPVLIISLFIGCSTIGNGKIDLPTDIIDVNDPATAYRAGRLVGVGIGVSDKGAAIDAAELTARILQSNPDYFAEVILEEILIGLNKHYKPGDPTYILIIEAGAAFGFANFDSDLIDGYAGQVNFEAIQWFSRGVGDGLNVAKGKPMPYPDFKGGV